MNTSAQVVQSDRIEIPLGDQGGKFEVIPAREEGLFLYRRLAVGKEDQLELIKIDTAFSVNWRGYLTIDARFELMGRRNKGNQLFLLLRHRELLRKDLELIVMENNSGQYVRYSIRNYIPFVPTEFQITSSAAIIGGYYNQVPVVIHYSFATQATKVLPGLLNESGELTQIKVFEDDSFDVLIAAANVQRQRTIWIKSYTPDGALTKQLPLQIDGKKHFLFARSLKTAPDTYLVAGTYGGRNSDYSKGIFISRINAQGDQTTQYYDYGELENFFKYMKVRREQRVKDRIERRKIKGKKTRFNYRFIVHEIVPYQNQFVLLGEAFYPRYVTVDRGYGFYSPMSFAYGSFMRGGRIFDGYRYTHAVVIGFDKEGKLLWDNSFEINDVKTFTLQQFVKLEMQREKIALLYLHENQLRSKIIKNNEVLEGKSTEPIRTKSEKDVAKSDRTVPSSLDYWYKDYFYACGVQEIVNTEAGERRVFFVNKVSYTDQVRPN